MARRTWRQFGCDLDTVVIEVWTGHQITWQRSKIFFKELCKAIKGGRQSWAEIEHQKLMERFKDLDGRE